MNIIIKQTTMGNEHINAVSARELHKALEIQTKFTDWIKQFIDDWSESIDFIRIHGKLNPTNGVPTAEYLFTTDMAKHLAMMTKTAKGKEVRQYFIEVEKNAKPKTRVELARELLAAEIKMEEAQKQITIQQSTIERTGQVLFYQARILESQEEDRKELNFYRGKK